MKIWVKAAGALVGLWMLGHLAYTTIDGLTDAGRAADVGVVLGNKVNEDGSLSERLRQRLLCGLKLYQSGRVKTLIVSGGLGREGYYEGDKMRDFLLQNGVPRTAIVVDNHGDNTDATVRNTLRLQDSLHFRSVLVVSQFYHLTRTKMLFRERGFTSVSGASPAYFEARDAYSLLREFFAYYTE
jgi:vancomycin permeability regulator SanA